MLTAAQNNPETYTPDYLESLHSQIESLHKLINAHSTPQPTKPVFINYSGAPMPDDKDPHLAKIDPGQLVKPLPGYEVGYVPVIISVVHPEAVSNNGVGLESAPDVDCTNTTWTDTYYPDL